MAWLASPAASGIERRDFRGYRIDEDRGQPLVEAFVGQVGDRRDLSGPNGVGEGYGLQSRRHPQEGIRQTIDSTQVNKRKSPEKERL